MLARYRASPKAVVLAFPRGGVPVGYEVASALGLPLDVLVVRKLGMPSQPELAMGAVASGGAVVLNDDVVRYLPRGGDAVEQVMARELQELARREEFGPIAAIGRRSGCWGGQAMDGAARLASGGGVCPAGWWPLCLFMVVSVLVVAPSVLRLLAAPRASPVSCRRRPSSAPRSVVRASRPDRRRKRFGSCWPAPGRHSPPIVARNVKKQRRFYGFRSRRTTPDARVPAQCAFIRRRGTLRALSHDPRCKSAHEVAEVAAHGIGTAAVVRPKVDAEIDVVR